MVAALVGVPGVLLSPIASYGIRTITAVLIVGVLWRRRVGLPPRALLARRLIAGALTAGVLSGLAASVILLVTDAPARPGQLADWLYLAYAPLAVGGMLAVPRQEAEQGGRLRTLIDASVAASALAFVVLGLLRESASTGSGMARAVAVGYPLFAVFVLSVLLSVLPQAHPTMRPFLARAGVGLALVMASDLGYSAGVLHSWYTPTTWPAVLNQAGLSWLLVAAVLPSSAPGRPPLTQERRRFARTFRPGAGGLVATVAPYLPVALWAGIGGRQYASGRGMSHDQLLPTIVMAAALGLRHVLAGAEQQRAMVRLWTREREATAAARHDPLTGLGNRTALYDELHAALSDPASTSVVLALLDLDDFKDINDTHGHDTGDEVLRQVAARLRAAVPPGSLVARLGGDEFAVCVRAPDQASALGLALLEALVEPLAIGARSFAIGASVGVVLVEPTAGGGVAEALSHVDVAMYQAKGRKALQRSNLVVLAGEARVRAAARVQLRDEVSRPDLSQFRVVYEPVVDLADGRIVGAEALLRWQHPVLGAIGPSEFVPLAEQVGAIGVLGEFALRCALADLAGWVSAANADGNALTQASVGVNLSPRQLAEPGLVALVRDVLAEHQLPPYRLVLEITEQALVEEWETAVDVVRELRQLGVAVAVDDFGTGYSSLRYLRRFDTSTVKVDREFVQAIADEPRTRALVASVLAMATALDLTTVAEGVETLDQLRILRGQGWQYAQGHLFDRPLEAAAFSRLLLAGHIYPVGEIPPLQVARPRVAVAAATRPGANMLPVVPSPRQRQR